MSLFFVDSSCDLDFQQIKNLGVEYFNLPYIVDGQKSKINDDIDYSKFYSKLRKGIVIENKNLTEKEYISIFEPAFKSNDDIIYVHSSDQIYNFNKLISARKKLLENYPDRRFELIDSKNFSAGHGAFAFMLALKFHSGCTIDEIVDYSYVVRDSIATYMVVDSIENLTNKNLLDSTSVVGTALNIKNILAIDIDGKFRVVDKISGKKRSYNKLIQIIRQNGKNIADNLIVISSACSNNDLEFITSELRKYFGEDLKIFHNAISPSNVSLIGSESLVISFNIHKKIH